MPGKNGSTQHTAAGAASAEQHQPSPPKFPRERKLYIVHNQNDRNDKARAPQPGTGRRRGMLDRSQQAQLGNLLRAIFSDVAEEPVPERFVKLLEALEAQEKSRE
jgi:Anti-sigma factor NepR